MIDGIPNRPLYLEKIPAQAIDSTPDLEVRCFDFFRNTEVTEIWRVKLPSNKKTTWWNFRWNFRWI